MAPKPSVRRITDYFNRLAADGTTDAARTDDDGGATPLFDPADDGDDLLAGVLSLPPDSPLITYPAASSSRHKRRAQTSDARSNPKMAKTAAASAPPLADKPAAPTTAKEALPFEDDDEDMDLLLNASYHFLNCTKKVEETDTRQSIADATPKPATTRTSASRANNDNINTMPTLFSISRACSAELSAILGTPPAASAKRANRPTHSLDSLLNDKMKREKQLADARAIDKMLLQERRSVEGTIVAGQDVEEVDAMNEDMNENSNPDSVLQKVVTDLLDQTSLPYPSTNVRTLRGNTTAVVKKPRRRKGSKTDVGTSLRLSSTLGGEEDEEDEDEDSLSATKVDAASVAALESKERIRSLVLDGAKGPGIVERVVMVDAARVCLPETSFSYMGAEGDEVTDMVVAALADADTRESFLMAGTISNSIKSAGWNLPDGLASWLFQTACFSKSTELAVAAARNLKISFEFESSSWIISVDKFHDALKAYGFMDELFNREDEPDITAFVQSVPRTKELVSDSAEPVAGFPTLNFVLCVELYTLCLIKRLQHYPPNTLQAAFHFLLKISMDERLTYATVDLLATSVAKIARALATDTTCAESCSRETVHSLAKFCGTDSMWQRDILAAPHSALVSACATSPSRVCPHRRGLALLAGVRRDLARAFVIRAGPRGGFFRASEGAESEDVGTEDAGVEREEGIVGMEMNAITSLAGVLDVVKRWNVGPGSTVYSRLSASVQVLAAAVGGVDGVRESLGDAKKLVEVLHRMHAAIPDARQLIAARSEAKEQIQNLKIWIELSLPETGQKRVSIMDYLEK